MHERYYVELAKQEKLLSRKNEKSDFYNGVFDRYVNPVLTRDMIQTRRPIHSLWNVLESMQS